MNKIRAQERLQIMADIEARAAKDLKRKLERRQGIIDTGVFLGTCRTDGDGNVIRAKAGNFQNTLFGVAVEIMREQGLAEPILTTTDLVVEELTALAGGFTVYGAACPEPVREAAGRGLEELHRMINAGVLGLEDTKRYVRRQQFDRGLFALAMQSAERERNGGRSAMFLTQDEDIARCLLTARPALNAGYIVCRAGNVILFRHYEMERLNREIKRGCMERRLRKKQAAKKQAAQSA